jgi:catechol 2,3-dioxygenase-like lactoylglutathione lyase family enzyme
VVSHIENTIPILRVADLEASKRYYLDVLGFALDWEAPYMISVSRDRKPLMLCHGHQGNPGTWVWIGCGSVDALFAEFLAKGATIRDCPQNFEWAYEMQVEDPDGHVLRFGSEPKDAPFGEFKA